LIEEDVAYQVKAGYARSILWEDLKQIRPKNLKVSPIMVVPQRDRRGRMILDLSFAVRKGKTGWGYKRGGEDDIILQESVNNSTVKLAPEVPVKELGNVLPRILHFMNSVPAEEHIHFSKMDLADGYWRTIVKPEAEWNFGYVMPQKPGEPIRLVIPSALQMGWNESPAYFCATTETAQDFAQKWIGDKVTLPNHLMEEFTAPAKTGHKQTSPGPLHQMSAVYVDDFVVACVETRT
jgi:hypothetical protein